MNLLNCISIDDDELSQKALVHCIERTDFLFLSGVFGNVKEALNLIQSKKIDLIFLDVEMPEISGIDFIKTFNDIPQIILVTGKKEYAVEAFDYNVTDFIVKPVDFSRFLKAASKAKQIHENVISSENPQFIFLKKDSKLVKVNLEDILWVEALADYVNIYTINERFTILSTMKSIESRFSKDFVRVHRSYIVRFDKIKTLEENSVLVGDKTIPISRSYRENLLTRVKSL